MLHAMALLQFKSVPLPWDSAAGRYKPPHGAAGHYTVILLRRLVALMWPR